MTTTPAGDEPEGHPGHGGTDHRYLDHLPGGHRCHLSAGGCIRSYLILLLYPTFPTLPCALVVVVCCLGADWGALCRSPRLLQLRGSALPSLRGGREVPVFFGTSRPCWNARISSAIWSCPFRYSAFPRSNPLIRNPQSTIRNPPMQFLIEAVVLSVVGGLLLGVGARPAPGRGSPVCSWAQGSLFWLSDRG